MRTIELNSRTGQNSKLVSKNRSTIPNEILKREIKNFTLFAATPYGQLPIFEEDGKQITQSGSICRYLGKKLGLAGKSDWEALQADAIVDTLTDLRLRKLYISKCSLIFFLLEKCTD